jgi:hypothetical protein
MMLAVPPRRSILNDCSAVAFRPMASKLWWTPPPVSSCTCLDRVAVGGVDHVGGAELFGQLQLGGHAVDGDDPAGAGDGRAVDGGQAHAAAADHGHGLARTDAGGVDHRADAGHHRAADQGGAVEGHVLADGDAGVLVHQHHLGEGRQVQELRHLGLAGSGEVLAEQAGLVALGARVSGADAQVQVAGQADLAVAAIGVEAGDDVVADLDGANLEPIASTIPALSWPSTAGRGWG